VKPGDRVRLTAPSPVLALQADTGTIVRADKFDGYWVIRLDEPADYRDAIGRTITLSEIREHESNLELCP
jgi:hypothetical protein